jgi:hypothetical protein
MKTPNPQLKKTQIRVNTPEERLKAIEYYESNGYPYDNAHTVKLSEYIGTYSDCDMCADFDDKHNDGYRLITLPRTKPNQNLRNTAIFVGDDEQLRKRAIEYYQANGYPFKDDEMFYEYIGTFESKHDKESSSFPHSMIRGYNKTIITLPEPEQKYPCMMLVSDDLNVWIEGEVICKHKGVVVAYFKESNSFAAFNFAKPIPTTTITTEELIEFYEKNNNTKVILV